MILFGSDKLPQRTRDVLLGVQQVVKEGVLAPDDGGLLVAL
jgi:hypothetical protein